jgi:hypothetical protein
MDDTGPTRVKRTSVPAIWKLFGLGKPNRIDKNVDVLLSTLLYFIVSPYASIWQNLFQIAFEVLKSVVGNPNPTHAITNPFTISHGSTGSRPIFGGYPAHNYHDPYVGTISHGLQSLQALYL